MLYTRTVNWNSKMKKLRIGNQHILGTICIALFDEMLPESCKMLFANVNTMIVYKWHKHLGVRILQMLWRPIVIVVITEWMFMVNIVLKNFPRMNLTLSYLKELLLKAVSACVHLHNMIFSQLTCPLHVYVHQFLA